MEKNETEEESTPELIGIMADSHGRAGTILAAVSVLRDRGCAVLYHLGDICDSAFPETTAACVRMIEKHHILAVKGNNEHTVSINVLEQEERRENGADREKEEAPEDRSEDRPEDCEAGRVSLTTALRLGRLPLVRRRPGALFCHSLPFEEELGLSAMVRVMDTRAALHFFNRYPGHVLFRGHNHQPEIIRFVNGAAVSASIPLNRRLSLAACRPCVITCGALTDGLCLIWNTREEWIRSLPCPD